MTALRSMMLVSAPADENFRRQVNDGIRPATEYLGLERQGVELLDWSRLQPPLTKRTWRGSVSHARAALDRLDSLDVVFSDGEPVGVPLALSMMARRRLTPHLVIGHRLTAPQKRPFFTVLKCHQGMARIVVHSSRQLDEIPRSLGIPADKLVHLPYYADGEFWKPRSASNERLVVSAGREHRDYESLAVACSQTDVAVAIADGSVHTPGGKHRKPVNWPANVRSGFATHVQLRELYARAAVVAIPLIENDFQAGITTILEAMSMGKAIVVTATSGQRDAIDDGVTGMTVPASDPHRLGEAIRFLLDHPKERIRLGRNARDSFEAQFTLDSYVSSLLSLMRESAAGRLSQPAFARERPAT